MQRRNTIQKEMVLKAVRSMKSHATADEIFEVIRKESSIIGKGTLYRNLNILVQDGLIRKIEISDGPDRFDDKLDEHYHVKCLECKKLFDVDMDIMPDLINNIRSKDGMNFLDFDILFKGICSDCQSKLVEEGL